MNGFPDLNPKDFKDLFAITDEMRLLRTNPSRLTLGDYRNLLTELCATIRLARERGLEQAIRYGSRLTNDPGIAAEIKDILSDMDAFIGFIDFEREALEACGASAETADAIAEELFNIREQLSRPGFDADQVIASLANGHAEICQASTGVTNFANSEQRLHEDKKRTLLTYGIASTLANSIGTAITAGAGFPFFGMSIAGGGVLITLRGTLEDPVDKPPRR